MTLRDISVYEYQRAAAACLENDDLEVIDVVTAQPEAFFTGFMSEQTRVTVFVKLPDGSVTELKLFVKLMPYDNASKCGAIKELRMFVKEWNFYSLIIPEFERFGCKLLVPRCYHGSEEFLILEDLTDNNFKIHDASQDFDYDHCCLVMQLLANLHAASLIYEETVTRERMAPYRFLDDGRFILEDVSLKAVDVDGMSIDWISTCLDAMKHLLNEVPKYKCNEQLLTNIKDKLKDEWERIKIILKSSDTVRPTICHADVWTNNLLFKYDQEGKPTEVRLVDFQCYRYIEPSSDIMIFLHISCNQRFRQNHEKKLLSLYYSTLVKLLSEHDLPETLFPEKEFLKSCENMRQVGRFYAAVNGLLTFLPPNRLTKGVFISEDPNEVINNRGKWLREIFLIDDLYRSRMTEAMEDFVDNNIIPTL